TMDAAEPAGFFSTFSIADPDGSVQEGLGRTQRRNRRVFVCIPCHRRKLKCNKLQPCPRCVKSRTPEKCVYQGIPSQNQEAAPSPAPRSPTATPGESRNELQARLEGATHWRSVASQFKEAWPYVAGSDPQWEARYQQILRYEALFPSLPGSNFPFSSSFTVPQNRAQVLNRLPPSQVVNNLVQSYFNTFESTHRLVHRQEFMEELNAFWINNTQLSEEWLAQLCMMSALGCQAEPSQNLADTGQNSEYWTDIFLDAAQFFFSQSQCFTASTLTTLRVLCLAAIARMVEIVKGAEMNQLVSLMGFATRLAMTMHLHRKSSLLPSLTPFEAEMRNRIWVTIQLLDLDTAMRTGTSHLHREQDANSPLDVNDTDFHRSEHGWVAVPSGPTDSTFQVKLAALLPTLTDVINTVNSPTLVVIDQERLRSWDEPLRQKLQEAEATLSLPPYGQPHNSERTKTQIHFLKVLVHRALLALHFSYIRAPRAEHISDSSLAIIQSSLELLELQHTWLSPSPQVMLAVGVQTRVSSPTAPALYQSFEKPTLPLSWLSDICRDHFGAAMFHLILAVQKGDFDTARHASLPSLADAMDILHESLEFKRGRACRSIPHFREFVWLSLSVSCLASFQAGELMLPGLFEAADEIEQMAIQSR
ncbi:fungal-specific transcription factor domain-containing protein, partial [Echria macrotheca]